MRTFCYLNLSYWGTGNGGPWMGDARSGDNLYANSVIALDVDSGELRAHHQYHWNGSWDWDEVSAPILMNVERGGRGERMRGGHHERVGQLGDVKNRAAPCNPAHDRQGTGRRSQGRIIVIALKVAQRNRGR